MARIFFVFFFSIFLLKSEARLKNPSIIERENSVYLSDSGDENRDNFINFTEDGMFSEGKMNEALRKVWGFVTKQLQHMEKRLNKVEEQTSQILDRLATVDCSCLPENAPSGVYTLYLDHRGTHSVRSFCDQDTEQGGWTVILKRIPHSDSASALNFSREFRDYQIGFGDPDGDFWIGLENIHLWTSYKNYQLRIVLTDFDGRTAYAQYDKFYIDGEDEGYRLHISGYSGTAGDSLGSNNTPDNYTADNMMFSTHDMDRDTSHEINCSLYWDIGGWWFNRCSWANLMGPYRLPGTGKGIGINWHKWRNMKYLKAAVMMIRPMSEL